MKRPMYRFVRRGRINGRDSYLFAKTVGDNYVTHTIAVDIFWKGFKR